MSAASPPRCICRGQEHLSTRPGLQTHPCRSGGRLHRLPSRSCPERYGRQKYQDPDDNRDSSGGGRRPTSATGGAAARSDVARWLGLRHASLADAHRSESRRGNTTGLDAYGDCRASVILARAQRREVRPNIWASLRSESGLPALTLSRYAATAASLSASALSTPSPCCALAGVVGYPAGCSFGRRP